MFTLCGAATIAFAFGVVRRALPSGGWTATAGSALLALSIVGLGDLLTPAERLACRLADPGCTTARQIADAIGQHYGLGGLFERLIALIGAIWIGSLAVAIQRRNRTARVAEVPAGR